MTTADQRGSFLVLTTWLIALLALLTIGVSFRGQMALRVTSYDVDMTQARLAAIAGVQQVLALVTADTNEFDALNEPWAANEAQLHHQAIVEGGAVFDVAYADPDALVEGQMIYGAQDEQARLHLNTATAEMIARLPLMDEDVAGAIVAFRDEEEHPAEDAYYGTLLPPYRTKGAAFEHLAEVGLVRGMTPERFRIVLQFCTVYPKAGAAVNLNTAPREVLLAVGLSASLVDSILAYRAGADAQPGTADDQPLTSAALTTTDDGGTTWILPNVTWIIAPEDAAILSATPSVVGVRSSAVRIRVTGRTADGTATAPLEAVLGRSTETGAPTTFAWHWE